MTWGWRTADQRSKIM